VTSSTRRVQRIRLNETSRLPIFQQIVDQVVLMITSGELRQGDRLPASRLLAANLQINRNTIHKAYGELRRLGYVSTHGRGGTVVSGGVDAPKDPGAREAAAAILAEPVRACMELGLSPQEIASIVYQQSLLGDAQELSVCVVECSEERAKAFAADLAEVVRQPIEAVVLDGLEETDIGRADLVITTFFHYAEVRRRVLELDPEDVPEFLAIVAAPHVKTLVRLAQIPDGHRIGILYSTTDQAEAIQQSLISTGLHDIVLIRDVDDPEIDGCDVVVVPSENPEIAEAVAGRATTVEFGNVLDPASIRMVEETVADLRQRGALAATGSA
jgi:GntR family transcriptional regulator